MGDINTVVVRAAVVIILLCSMLYSATDYSPYNLNYTYRKYDFETIPDDAYICTYPLYVMGSQYPTVYDFKEWMLEGYYWSQYDWLAPSFTIDELVGHICDHEARYCRCDLILVFMQSERASNIYYIPQTNQNPCMQLCQYERESVELWKLTTIQGSNIPYQINGKDVYGFSMDIWGVYDWGGGYYCVGDYYGRYQLLSFLFTTSSGPQYLKRVNSSFPYYYLLYPLYEPWRSEFELYEFDLSYRLSYGVDKFEGLESLGTIPKLFSVSLPIPGNPNLQLSADTMLGVSGVPGNTELIAIRGYVYLMFQLLIVMWTIKKIHNVMVIRKGHKNVQVSSD